MILNLNSILENSRENIEARKTALTLIEEGLRAANPMEAIKRHVQLRGNILQIDGHRFNLNNFDRIIVVGGGKASGRMALALEEILQDKITTGLVNILHGTSKQIETKYIQLNEAGHPIPDKAGLTGALKILEILDSSTDKDLVLCLISGGGSALLPCPVENVSLEELQELTQLLLRSGATINEINVVRKHLSQIKGGQLARKAYPATLISLIISDVVGDPIDTIASGPTAPDPSTYADALRILRERGLTEEAPKNIIKHLENGANGKIPETPKPGDPIFQKVYNVIIANNLQALKRMKDKALQMKINSLILTSHMEGEAKEIGILLAGIIRELRSNQLPINPPAAILLGGETTVTVKGDGLGGRNQELVLSASTKIRGLKEACIASVGSDGIDGPTDAAGAIADGETISRASNLGLDPLEYLKRNDSYNFFKKLNDLIITDPTGANINDLTVIAVM